MATSGKLASFFRILPDEPFTTKLKIPTQFLQHFHGNVPHQCRLQAKDQTCLVHVEMVNNKFYFQKGWSEFLQRNDLKYGQLLVFHYAGNSHFHVDIFGKDTCGELLVMTETEEDEEEDDDDDVSLEISDESRKKYKTNSSGKARMKAKVAYWPKSEIKKKNRGGTSTPQIFTGESMWRARIRAEAFKAKNPSAFLVSMKPSYIKFKFVWLPKEFSMQLGPFIENSGDVILRVSDRLRIWRVTLNCDDRNRCKLQGCWADFMRDNNLKEGDVCAFRLIAGVRISITVDIFRTEGAASCTYPPDITDNEDDDDNDEEVEEEEDHENDEEGVEETEDESEDEEETEHEEEEEDDFFSETLKYAPSGSRTVASRHHKRRRVRRSYTAKAQRNIRHDGGLSREEKILNDMALEKAYAVKPSDRPSFVVSLCSSYAGGSYMNFPHRFAQVYMPEQPNRIILSAKRRFLVNVNYFDKATRLQAGWSEFARENNLKLGDVCLFVLTTDKLCKFDVEIFRMTDAAYTSSQEKGKQLRRFH